MIYTTLNKILAAGPCGQEIRAGQELRGWLKLLHYLNKTESDDEPLGFDVILKAVGFKDALWCAESVPEHNTFWRLLAAKFARTVQHLMTNQKSLDALDVAERHAHGNATDEELEAVHKAIEAACAAVEEATWWAAWAAWAAAAPWAAVAEAAEAAGAAGAARVAAAGVDQETLEKIFIDALNSGETK